QELHPLLVAETELNHNGRNAIGGLSMGAIGAVHIANTNPEIFDATFGISGCYSTNDNAGRQMVNLVVTSRGGDVENMWGPYGSAEWDRHDTVADPEGLRNMAVYLSAADGSFTEEVAASYDDDPFFNMSAGSVLERGVLSCTEKLDRAMRDAGMTHQVVDYKGPGVHNWANYSEQLQPAWDAIKGSLY
ncbi:alpha/beta hydrolase-fold protein, partial [Corynebacterium sp.]|uniref:alpha/beta hydrolase-fold protein n=1 Tax=Corynebacterium sp. TaxID=1720 RepID=UPI0019A6F417